MYTFNKSKVAVLVAAMLASGSAMAQESAEENESEADSKNVEVITVTGGGRPQLASEVPMNITAIGAEELRRKNITDVKKLIADSVEISSPGNSSRFAESVTVRGLNVANVNANNLERFVTTTVAYYLDDTTLPNIAYRIKDINRVEKLLGPQGTLYGGGSLGGTIRYITNKPDLEEFSADFNTSIYQVKGGSLSHDTDLVLNMPLSETVAVRALYSRLDDGGFTDRVTNHPWLDPADYRRASPNPDKTLYEDDDWEETDTGRIQLLWQPNDKFKMNLSYITQDQLAHGTRAASRWDVGAYCAATGADEGCVTEQGAPFVVDDKTVLSVHEEYSDRTFDMASLELEWDMDFATLTSSTAKYEDTRLGQGDYINEGYVYYGVLAFIPSVLPENTNESAYIRYDNDYEGFSHEMRLTSNGDSPLSWIAGLYHTKREQSLRFWEIFPSLDDAMVVDYGGFDPRSAYPDRAYLDSGYFEDISSEYKETAIYGELSYNVTDDWSVTLGARFFKWEDTALKNISDYTGFLGVTEDQSKDDDSGESIFKFNTSYNLSDDVFVYGTVSQGYRRGGTNAFRDDGELKVDPNTQRYEPDTTTNYELGIKGSFLDNDLYVQANVYRIDWEDTQTYFSQSLLGFPLNGTANGPDSRSTGFEAQARYNISDNLSVRLATAKTSAEFTEDGTVCLFEDGSECRTWYDGDELGGSPEWRHNVSVNYTTDLGEGVLSGDLRYKYVDSQLSGRQDQGFDPYIFDSYSTLDSSISYSQDDWSVTLWVDNLTDDDGETSYQRVGGTWGYRSIYILPRTVGVNFSYSFY